MSKKDEAFKNTGQPAGDVTLPIVPLVDVIFLLVLFFILTTEMASKSYAVVELPRPLDSLALDVQEKSAGDRPNRVIVNVLSKDEKPQGQRDPQLAGEAKEYQIEGAPIQVGDKETLVREFKKRRAEAMQAGMKEFFVEVRADKDVNWLYVAPVIEAASEADIPKMNVTALTAVGGGK